MSKYRKVVVPIRTLRDFFPSLKTRQEVLQEIQGRVDLKIVFDQWSLEEQNRFLDICSGNRGLVVLYELIEAYPEFRPIYDQIFEICRDTGRMMDMFSKELQMMDHNTVKLMIDEMQEDVKRKEAEIRSKDAELKNKDVELKNKDMEIQEMKAEIARLREMTGVQV